MKVTNIITMPPLGMGMGDNLGSGLHPSGIIMCPSAQKRAWLPVALAAAGLASSVLGGMSASKAARRAERRQREREAEENAYFTRRYNEDYADTAAGQNLIRRAKDYARENWRRAAGAQAVAGGTDAAAAMAKEAGNKMVGDTLANIAAQDTAKKSQIDAQHNAARQQFAQLDMQRDAARAQAIAQASQGASNAMLGAAAALSQDASGTDLTGGSNNSTDTTPTRPMTDDSQDGPVIMRYYDPNASLMG